ncbi:MAG: molybdenum cofactor guanylyltransferase [Lachnospiraceae bacterium]|nr:molybdenum cofactor guanylyltransferase [Lachnospiraceae bacterium]
MNMIIGCMILAGGKSSRMGTDKALLEIDGTNFIGKIAGELNFFVEKFLARGNCEVVSIPGWQNIPDIYPECGPIGGLHAALKTCRSDALVCVTCDMPLLKSELVRDLCDQMTEEYDAVILKEADGRIHPTCGIYRKSAVNVFEQQILDGNYRMMQVLDRLRVKYVTIDPQIGSWQLKNINTPEDLRELKKEADHMYK